MSNEGSDAKTAHEFLEAQKHYYQQLHQHKEDFKKFQSSKQEHIEVLGLLKDLPKKTRHSIMVPMGPMAFMPGELVHTNEVLVLLGENYFAEQSAVQAAGIVQRRIDVINDILEKTEKNVKDLAARNSFSQEARHALLKKMHGDLVDAPKSVPEDLAERADEDDDDEGLGQDFWNTVGFFGTSASDYHDPLEDDSENTGAGEATADGLEQQWNDAEPVFEIFEPLDGGDSKIISHASQRFFRYAPATPPQ